MFVWMENERETYRHNIILDSWHAVKTNQSINQSNVDIFNWLSIGCNHKKKCFNWNWKKLDGQMRLAQATVISTAINCYIRIQLRYDKYYNINITWG